MVNFSLFEQGTSIAATTASATAALPKLSGHNANDILIYNTDTSNTVYVRIGNAATTANTSCMPILPGEKSIWAVKGATHIATIRAAGSASIIVFPGEGN